MTNSILLQVFRSRSAASVSRAQRTCRLLQVLRHHLPGPPQAGSHVLRRLHQVLLPLEGALSANHISARHQGRPLIQVGLQGIYEKACTLRNWHKAYTTYVRINGNQFEEVKGGGTFATHLISTALKSLINQFQSS